METSERQEWHRQQKDEWNVRAALALAVALVGVMIVVMASVQRTVALFLLAALVMIPSALYAIYAVQRRDEYALLCRSPEFDNEDGVL
jgi:peptidoglycan/LPS O-acetylase OafA/YrhL